MWQKSGWVCLCVCVGEGGCCVCWCLCLWFMALLLFALKHVLAGDWSVCVGGRARARVFSWYPLTDVTDTHSFPSRLRAPENRSPSASSSTPPLLPDPFLPHLPLLLSSGSSAHADEHRASTAAQQDHTSLKPNIWSLEESSRSCLQERHLTRALFTQNVSAYLSATCARLSANVCVRARAHV